MAGRGTIRDMLNQRMEDNLKSLENVSGVVKNVYSGYDLKSIEAIDGLVCSLEKMLLDVFAATLPPSNTERPVLEDYAQYVDLRLMEMSHREIAAEMSSKSEKQFSMYKAIAAKYPQHLS